MYICDQLSNLFLWVCKIAMYRINFISDNIDGQRVEVYTDGSCTHNGRRGARAGIGVHWIGQSDKDISERLKGKQTNQRAELTVSIFSPEK